MLSSIPSIHYRPRSKGDNTFGSVCLSVCPSVRPSLCGRSEPTDHSVDENHPCHFYSIPYLTGSQCRHILYSTGSQCRRILFSFQTSCIFISFAANQSGIPVSLIFQDPFILSGINMTEKPPNNHQRAIFDNLEVV